MVSSVDDPVAFVNNVKVQEAVTELIADLGGPFIIASMVEVTMKARTTNIFADAGGRRLLGLIDIHFRVTVPIIVDDSGNIFLGPDLIVVSFIGLNLLRMSSNLVSRLEAKGVGDLSRSLYIQSVSASESVDTTVTTTTTQTYDNCPKDQLCVGQTCGSCDALMKRGLECQKRMHPSGECTCSCFFVNDTLTTPGPKGQLANAATGETTRVLGIVATIAATIVAQSHLH